MNAAQTGIENLDLEKLNDKDKTELRQFLANEQQRSQIQARMCCSFLLLISLISSLNMKYLLVPFPLKEEGKRRRRRKRCADEFDLYKCRNTQLDADLLEKVRHWKH